MIKVIISYKNNNIYSVSLSGHANYSEHGKDIVCASVSTMAMTTINALNVLCVKYEYEILENKIIIYNKYNDETVNKLLISLDVMLNDLVNDYKENIMIRKEEI